MDEDEDWMLRVIKAAMLPYTALNDSTYDLEDFLLCSEYLDVEGENAARVRAITKGR